MESGAYNFGFNPVIVVLDRYGEVTPRATSPTTCGTASIRRLARRRLAICTATPKKKKYRGSLLVYLPVLSASISLAASRPDSITIGTPPPGWVVPPAK